MYEQMDIFVPRKNHVDYRDRLEATGVQLKPETYIEWSIALIRSIIYLYLKHKIKHQINISHRNIAYCYFHL